MKPCAIKERMFLLHSDIKVRIGGYFLGCLPSCLGMPYGGIPEFGRRIADEAKQNGSAIVSYGNTFPTAVIVWNSGS